MRHSGYITELSGFIITEYIIQFHIIILVNYTNMIITSNSLSLVWHTVISALLMLYLIFYYGLSFLWPLWEGRCQESRRYLLGTTQNNAWPAAGIQWMSCHVVRRYHYIKFLNKMLIHHYKWMNGRSGIGHIWVWFQSGLKSGSHIITRCKLKLPRGVLKCDFHSSCLNSQGRFIGGSIFQSFRFIPFPCT